ncbi:unnamed protein product [Paramecium pentaurelia]|uniref:Uncharacterized protein n=1 Tax=Paramecium pentaurelia TaxID=43138 RepID=A0A8S1YAZ3_9CILI|nr:unnamed protein product [Paramecium pentaurelia]
MGACKSCTQQPSPEIKSGDMEQPGIRSESIHMNSNLPMEQPGIRSESIRKISNLLNEFQAFQIIKKTSYSFIQDAAFRNGRVITKKLINTQGTVKPINLSQLHEVNKGLEQLKALANKQDKCEIEKSMKFKCGLELGDKFPLIKFHMLLKAESQTIVLQDNTYTLIKSWGQGEQMVNFQHAIELVDSFKNVQFQLIGLTRGNEEQQSVYEELVRSNPGWQQHQHIYVLTEEPENHIFDIFYQEQTNDIEEGYIASALLFYGQNLIWKRYALEWDMSADSDEVALEVTNLLNTGVKEYVGIREMNQQSNINKQQYLDLKRFILQQQQQQQFTRSVEVTLNKKTIYGKNNKQVIYEKPIIQVSCSPKSQQITENFIKPLQQKPLIWDIQILKKLLTQKIKENNLNIEASLEKQIKIQINYENNFIQIPNWELATLTPYYKSTQYISQVKQWIHARDRILSEVQDSKDPVLQKVNKMIYQFFNNIPTVEKVLNQQYGKIPYAEKRKPPYEEMSVSKSLGNEEITRKQDNILFILLIDYENDDTLNMLKNLINFKKNAFIQLQIAVLGHIRAESWTKLFQAFMEKHQLDEDAQQGIIETWFPVEDKIGSISFSAILSKMYGMNLEKRDCMLVDLDNQVRIIDSSRRIIPKISQILNDLQKKNQIQEKEFINYLNQYQQFKRSIRDNPQLLQLTQQIKEQCKDDDCLIVYEQRKAKIWDFEGENIIETRKHQQPTKILRLIPKTSEMNELTKIIDNSDFLQMK